MISSNGRPLTVLIQGTGLIGTSVGLALSSAGWTVHLRDPNADALGQAHSLGAGSKDAVNVDDVDLVVVAAPPAVTAEVVTASLDEFSRAIVTDVASLKENILRQVHAHPESARFIGGHPLAGRELSGPTGARSDLFEGRPWVITPSADQDAAQEVVERLISTLRADKIVMSAKKHDESVAATSHLPQIMASATAARLIALDSEALSLSGQGLRDVTRIAGSDPDLWGQIIEGNAQALDALLGEVIDDLTQLRADLHDPSANTSAVATDLVRKGQSGQARIPGKHGSSAQRYVSVSVVIPDEPGRLAALFDAVGLLGVNIEDVSLEHSPGQPVGLATVFVIPASVDTLAQGLEDSGWVVYR